MIETKFVKIKGISVAYREMGVGEILLFIHGMGSSLVFDEIIEPLSKYFKVIVIDLPGFGKSEKPDLDYNIDFYVNILFEFCKEINLEKINVAGLSLGGMIAIEFAYRYPQSVNNLLVLSSSGLKPIAKMLNNIIFYLVFSFVMKYIIFSNKWLTKKFQIGSYFNPKKINPIVFRKFFEYIKYPESKKAWLSALKNVFNVSEEFVNHVREIRVNTIIIWGKNDKTIPLIIGDKFSKLITNSKMFVIDECGHPITVEQPSKVIEIIVNELVLKKVGQPPD